MEDRPTRFRAIQDVCHETFVKKNADYGDAFHRYGIIGVLMRIDDKIQRAMNISKTQVVLVSTESLRDTLMDLHNYAVMAIMLMDEQHI